MNLTLQRNPSDAGATLGTLAINKIPQCFTLEDQVRPDGVKVYGETAIPAGRYRVLLTQSRRFKRVMPLIADVPGFEGIRIHSGNTAEDTLGCVLVGQSHESNTVGSSRLAFEALFSHLLLADQTGEEIWIDIIDA